MTHILHKRLVMKDIEQRNFEECSNPTLIKQIRSLGVRSYEDGCKLKELLGQLIKENYSASEESLDALRRLPILGFKFFLDYFPASKKLKSSEEMSLIRMMEYYLEEGKYEHFFLISKKIRPHVLSLWFDINFDKVLTILNTKISDYNHSAFFVLLAMDSVSLERYYPCVRKVSILEKSFCSTYKNLLLEESLSSVEYIDNPYFMKLFAKMDYLTQVYLAELIEGNDFDRALVNNLHKLFNQRPSIDEYDFYQIMFEMSEKKLKVMLHSIVNSSYFHKSDIKNQKLWKIISSKDYHSEIQIEDNYKTWFSDLKGYPSSWKIISYKDADKVDLSFDYYSFITDTYEQCRDFARKSIVNSLYPLNYVTDKVTYLIGSFNILARTRSCFEPDDISIVFEAREFCSFCTINEKNVSHYGNSTLYGYFTGVVPELIAHIYPQDSLSRDGARFVRRLTNKSNWFLDIVDLNHITYMKKTYNQLCVRTKNNGKILMPDCIICIGKVDERSQKDADELGLNILVVPKLEDTIEDNEDIYWYLK